MPIKTYDGVADPEAPVLEAKVAGGGTGAVGGDAAIIGRSSIAAGVDFLKGSQMEDCLLVKAAA